MNLHQHPLNEELPAASPTPPEQRQWNWLRVARGVWIAMALVFAVIFVANIPSYYLSLNTYCTAPTPYFCSTGQLTVGNVQALGYMHLSVTVVTGFLATLTLAVSVLYWMVGILIFWRKSQEWMGLFFSLALVMLGAIDIFGFPVAQTPHLIQVLTNSIENALLAPAGAFFFLTFPTGQFTPRWTWALFIVIWLTLTPIAPPVALLMTVVIIIGVQVYRYVRVCDVVQRQQTKWFVFGFGVGLSFFAIYNVIGALVPDLSAPDSVYQLVNVLLWFLVWAILLLSVSIPILRYRLWDIDIIINRTLVYGSLTILLVALYVGLILALQALVRAVTGNLSEQPLVIVASTLVIAALFQPLRHRLQALIDRRFYRRKYDAAKITAAFSSTLRNEVDLDQLREHLLAVVQETMQPSHISLWVRQPLWTAIPTFQIDKPSPEEAGVREEIARHST